MMTSMRTSTRRNCIARANPGMGVVVCPAYSAMRTVKRELIGMVLSLHSPLGGLMPRVFALLLLVIAQPALAWESLTLNAGISAAFSPGHKPHVGLEVGGSYAFGFNTVSPSVGARARLLFDKRGPVLPQAVVTGGVTAGPLTPLISAQIEAGMLFAAGAVRPSYGASVWTAPAEIVSPFVGVSWTHFTMDRAPQDLFQATGGVALVAPTYILLIPLSPVCEFGCD
ncbi:MAG: hypothetical protein ACJATT_005183 [Myxococcota bacterium]|jgi:hypothetical protein